MPDIPAWLIAVCLVVCGLFISNTSRYRNRQHYGTLGRNDIIHKAMQAGAARGRSDAILGKPSNQYEVECPSDIYSC